jgi:hypothetical protein
VGSLGPSARTCSNSHSCGASPRTSTIRYYGMPAAAYSARFDTQSRSIDDGETTSTTREPRRRCGWRGLRGASWWYAVDQLVGILDQIPGGLPLMEADAGGARQGSSRRSLPWVEYPHADVRTLRPRPRGSERVAQFGGGDRDRLALVDADGHRGAVAGGVGVRRGRRAVRSRGTGHQAVVQR